MAATREVLAPFSVSPAAMRRSWWLMMASSFLESRILGTGHGFKSTGPQQFTLAQHTSTLRVAATRSLEGKLGRQTGVVDMCESRSPVVL